MVLPLPAVCVASFGLGVFVEMMMVQWTVTMARNIPSDKLARVSSYDVLGSVMAMPAGALIAGPLGAAIGAARAQYAAAAVIIVGLGLAGGARYHGGVAGVAVMVAASILVGVVFGALSNAVGMTLRSREAIIGVYTFFMLPLMFLSSAFMQTSLMPGWMQAIASRNPLNWVVQIGRSAVSAHPDWAAIGVRCGGLLVLAVACVAISVATFRSYQKNV